MYVHNPKEPINEKIAKGSKEYGLIRYRAHSGITPLTQFINQRFFRKKTAISVDEVRKIEADLHALRQDPPKSQEF